MSLGGLFFPGLIRWEELLRTFFSGSESNGKAAGREETEIDPGEARDGGVVLSCPETDPVADGTVCWFEYYLGIKGVQVTVRMV